MLTAANRRGGEVAAAGIPPIPGNRTMKEANPHLAARRAAKAALLPRAAQLAAEGRTYQEIADALGIAKSTVCGWLRGRPLGRAAAKALGTPRMTAKLAARYELLYQGALREWNRSKADRRTQTVVTREPAGGSPTTTTTVRTEPRTGNAACLGKALAAMKAMEGLHCRERLRQEWFENLKRDAAGNEDALTQTVKTRTTPSGRNVRTVVTTRSVAAHRPSPQDALEGLDEMRRALEARLEAAEHAAPAGSPISRKENGAAESGSAKSANGSAAGTPHDRRKSFVPPELHLPGYDFSSVRRSVTLPNEVVQKGGAGKGRKKAKGGRRKPVSPPPQASAPRRGSAATLMQEIDRIFSAQGPSQSFPGLGG